MKTNTIEVKLQKYYDGLTSPEEEAELEEYFMQDSVDSLFEAEKLQFQAITSIKNDEIPIPYDLEETVLQALHNVQSAPRRTAGKVWTIVLSTAAALVLMVSTAIYLFRQNQPQPLNDPKIAYQESLLALETVSKYFNKGTEQLAELDKINQAIEPLNKLNTLDEAVKKLSALGKQQSDR